MTVSSGEGWPWSLLIRRLPFALITLSAYSLASWWRLETLSLMVTKHQLLLMRILIDGPALVVYLMTIAAYLGLALIAMKLSRRIFKWPSQCGAPNWFLRVAESLCRALIMAAVYWFGVLIAFRLILINSWTNEVSVAILMQYPLWRTWEFMSDILRWWLRERPGPGERLKWWAEAPSRSYRVLRQVFGP